MRSEKPRGSAGSAGAAEGDAGNAVQPPGPAAQRYLGACADTRKAWYSTSMLTRARPEQIRHVRQELASGDAWRIAHVLCDMSGPMHPGDAARAQDPMTRNGSALARCVVQAVLETVLATDFGAAAGPDGGVAASAGFDAPRQVACLEELKRHIAFWIDHGRLDGEDAACGLSPAGQIAQFLREHNPDLDETARAMLRLACVALTAPAVEGAWVIARLSEGFLEAQASTFGTFAAQAGKSQHGGAHDGARNDAHADLNTASSAMHRDEQDDLADQSALDALNRLRGLMH
jgi:hypothetical protein